MMPEHNRNFCYWRKLVAMSSSAGGRENEDLQAVQEGCIYLNRQPPHIPLLSNPLA
jgi:hypothetical protein